MGAIQRKDTPKISCFLFFCRLYLDSQIWEAAIRFKKIKPSKIMIDWGLGLIRWQLRPNSHITSAFFRVTYYFSGIAMVDVSPKGRISLVGSDNES